MGKERLQHLGQHQHPNIDMINLLSLTYQTKQSIITYKYLTRIVTNRKSVGL